MCFLISDITFFLFLQADYTFCRYRLLYLPTPARTHARAHCAACIYLDLVARTHVRIAIGIAIGIAYAMAHAHQPVSTHTNLLTRANANGNV